MFRSNQAPRRSTRPSLETLEGRTLLSATPLLQAPMLLVPGYHQLSPARVNQALRAVESRLAVRSAGSAPSGPISADLDQNGVLDTIGLSHSPGGRTDILQILYGGTTLGPPTVRQIALDFVARQLIVGDFEGYGRMDIFAQEGDSATGMLLLSRADGLFDAYRQQANRSSFAVADLVTPGVDDLVYGPPPASPPAVDPTTGVRAAALEVGELPATGVQLVDLDQTGKPDLVATSGDGSIQVYAGLGNGRFSSQPQQVADAFAGTGPVQIAFASLADQMGLGMAVASASLSEVAVYYRQHDGSFLQGQVMQVGLSPSSVSLVDVTKDGNPDLLVTCAGSNSLWIFRNLGNGRFDDTHPLILAAGDDPTAAFVGNFDGKGGGEIVVLDRGSNATTFYRSATAPLAQPVQLASGGAGPTAAVVRDVNGDGYDDLIVANHDSGQVTLFYGGPNGLREGQTIDRSGTYPAALAVGPGLPSSYQFYVLDDGSNRAEILTFTPPPTNGLSSEKSAPPALDSVPEVRLVFQSVSGARADSVPILLAGQPEGEETTLGNWRAPSKASAPPSTGNTAAKFSGAATGATAAEESPTLSPPNEIAAQRYLLGLDDIPAPALESATAIPSPLADMLAEPERGARADEPEPAGGPVTRTSLTEDPHRNEGGGAPAARETDGVAIWDVLLGVLLVLGVPSVWTGPSRLTRSLRDALGKRDTR